MDVSGAAVDHCAFHTELDTDELGELERGGAGRSEAAETSKRGNVGNFPILGKILWRHQDVGT